MSFKFGTFLWYCSKLRNIGNNGLRNRNDFFSVYLNKATQN